MVRLLCTTNFSHGLTPHLILDLALLAFGHGICECYDHSGIRSTESMNATTLPAFGRWNPFITPSKREIRELGTHTLGVFVRNLFSCVDWYSRLTCKASIFDLSSTIAMWFLGKLAHARWGGEYYSEGHGENEVFQRNRNDFPKVSFTLDVIWGHMGHYFAIGSE
jgi:hypothetical protein